jgi:threonine synthase
VSLGEGWTPLILLKRLRANRRREPSGKGRRAQPDCLFKARGLACAISICVQRGICKVAIPSADSTVSALAAYAGATGLGSYIFMPKDMPQANDIEWMACRAHATHFPRTAAGKQHKLGVLIMPP